MRGGKKSRKTSEDVTPRYDLNDKRTSYVKIRKTSLSKGSKLGRKLVTLRHRKAHVVEGWL